VDLTSGLITTAAGNGLFTPLGDGGLATQTALLQPVDIAVDRSGNIYIVDGTQRVRKVDARTNIIATVAGMDRVSGFSGDNGAATSAAMNGPSGIAVDNAGNIYISDTENNRVRKVDSRTGIITTVAGNGLAGFSGDGGRATEASLQVPEGIAVDSAGNLYITDLRNYRVRKVDAATGIISTVAGNGRNDSSFVLDGVPATQSALIFPRGVAVDGDGNILIADYYQVRKVSASSGIITTVAGNGNCCLTGDNGPATQASVDSVRIAVDPLGNLYIADWINGRIRAVRGPLPARRRP
jgi:sugar lactone lactonase YvrE